MANKTSGSGGGSSFGIGKDAKDTGYVYVINGKGYPIYEATDHKLWYNDGKKDVHITPDLLQTQWGQGTIKADTNKKQNMSTEAAQSTYNTGISLPNIVNGYIGTVSPLNPAGGVLNTISNMYDYATGKPNQHSYLNQNMVPLSGVGNILSTAGKFINDVKGVLNSEDVQTYLDNAKESNTTNNSNTLDTATNYINSLTNYLTDDLGSVGTLPGISARQPKLMSAQELADLYGLKYDYDYILGVYNDASDAYYKQITEKAKQLKEDALRNQVGLYYQYLDTMRDARANAVNTGINKGAQAANEVAQYLAQQQTITDERSKANQSIYDLYNEALTKQMENRISALKDYNSLGGDIMNAGATFHGNDVQRYAADLSASAANAQAQATINSARINAQSALQSAYMNSYMNPANSQLLQAYLNNINSNTAYNNAQAKKDNK